MRPTDLNFRSPKVKSGEYTFPQCDYKGGNVIGPTKFSKNAMTPIRENINDDIFKGVRDPFMPQKKTTFSNERRFREPLLLQKRTGNKVGPGSYFNDPFNSIEARVNASHHSVSITLILILLLSVLCL